MSGLAAAVELAAKENYLGSPKVVLSLVGKIFDTIATHNHEATYSQHVAVVHEVAQAFSSDDAGFTRMHAWNTEKALGKAAVKYFNLDPEYHEGENLAYLLAEGFLALGMQIDKMLKAFEQDKAATWNPDALIQLNELHHWTAAVMLGTNVVTDPDRTLNEFTWRPMTPNRRGHREKA